MQNTKGRTQRIQYISRDRLALPEWLPISTLLLLALSLFFRLWDLEIKPPHFDEGINGHFVREMWHDGFYRYDPTNFHGPLYFYVLQFAQVLLGEGIYALRFVTALISTGVVFLLTLHRRFLGAAAAWAAVIVTFSPAFVFYSRYAIHESLFVFLEILFLYGFLLWREEKSKLSFALMVGGFFGAFATKETFFIFFVTFAIALWMESRTTRFFPVAVPPPIVPESARAVRRPPSSVDDRIAIVLLGLLVTFMLFSGFFMNEKGLRDMVLAYSFWSKTGLQGTGHEKPFYYWLRLFWLYEWPAGLGLLLSPIAFFLVSRTERWLILIALGTVLAYTLIPYKTPWLILNLIWPLALVVGFILSRQPRKYVLPLVLLGLVVSAREMLRLNFRDFANPMEPYVYVQSTNEFKESMDYLAARVRAFPEDLNMHVVILNREAWPMPWMLQDFPNLQYAHPSGTESDGADVILVDGAGRQELEAHLTGKYWVEPFQIRESYDKGFAFFKFEKFKDIVPASSAVFERPAAGGAP